jgi:hypothetical protein
MATLNGVGFDLQTVRAIDDARIRETQFVDGILRGCALTFSGADLTIATGAYMFKGREVAVDSDTTLTTVPTYTNGYARLKYVIDLSQAASDTSFTQGATVLEYASSNSFAALTQQDINDGTHTSYEVEICRVQYTSGSITSIVSQISSATNKTIPLTAGTAPAFTIADTSVTAYAAGLRRTIQFHVAGTAATLNFNSKGAKNLYEYTGKAMSVKAGQVVDVYYDGTSFFAVSVSGGVAFPDTPSAGDTVVYAKLPGTLASIASASYAYVGAGYGFTANKSGVYRVKYLISNTQSSSSSYTYAKLQKNGVDVANSEISANGPAYSASFHVSKIIDVSLSSGDTIKLFGRYVESAGLVIYFVVSILADEVQGAISEMLTPTTI